MTVDFPPRARHNDRPALRDVSPRHLGLTTTMSEPQPDLPPVMDLRRRARALDRAGRVAVLALPTLGLIRAVPALLAGRGGALPVFEALSVFGGYALAGVLAGVALRAVAGWLDLRAAEGVAALRWEAAVAEGCARLAEAVASRPAAAERVENAPGRKPERIAEVRQAIRGGLWADARALVTGFAEAHPGDADADRLGDELAEARRTAAEEILARVEAARGVNDAERVIELREGLGPLLDPEPLRELDRDLGRWFLLLIGRRLRTGTVRTDVAALAGRVAEAFDDTPEGASLRASLPTLRRAAGLCPRCAQPYRGVEDACPVCLAAQAVPPPPPTPETVAAEPVVAATEFEDEETGEGFAFEKILDSPSYQASQLDGPEGVG